MDANERESDIELPPSLPRLRPWRPDVPVIPEPAILLYRMKERKRRETGFDHFLLKTGDQDGGRSRQLENPSEASPTSFPDQINSFRAVQRIV